VMFLDGGVIVEEGAARDVILSPREPRTQVFLKQIRH
jgi:polar amino acid transport system ATP-binding protein